jgi:Acetyltransferase (GNAT) domain
MAKRAKAPKGFYAASDVMRILGIGNSTLYHYVSTGKIKKVVPPDRSEGYYIKSEVDKMAQAKELFLLQYSSDSSVFRKAKEKDIQAIHNLSIEVFGSTIAPSYESRLAPYTKNPNIYYIVEQDDILVGYLGMTPIRQDVANRVMGETEDARSRLLTSMSEIVTPENILMFEPGEVDNVYLIAVSRQGLARSKFYAMRLILGGYEVLKDYALRGVIVKKLYSVSRTPDGIKLCKNLGFREVVIPENPVRRFELDLETTTSPLLQEYKTIVAGR